MASTAAILYHPGAFDASIKEIMGRQAAGAGFLRGLARHSQAASLYCYGPSRAILDGFAAQAAADGWRGPCRWIATGREEALAEPGALFNPDPGLAAHAWTRRRVGNRRYSLTAVTHTICSTAITEAIGEYLTAPVQTWDALICTSRAGRAVVAGRLDAYQDYLAERLGASRWVRPQLPVIPLGVDAEALAPADAPALRAGLRARLNIGDDEVAFLFLGRLVFHAKAHAVPMFLALERAAAASGRSLCLLLAGRYPNEAIGRSFRETAAACCPHVRVIEIDGEDPEAIRASWFAADVFTSLSDNIQETYGLTPVEAMAAGLPVVVSDWDGYRDTVADGETGCLIPVHMAAPGDGEALIRPYADGRLNYDHYVGAAALCTAIDGTACAEAYARLAGDGALRRRMGAAGRRRVTERFSWRVVIAAYQALWAELAERRRGDGESAPNVPSRPAVPLHADPFEAFAGYPTGALTGTRVLALAARDPEAALAERLGESMNTFALPLICGADDLRALVARLAVAPASLDQLAALDPGRAAALRRGCAWLLKFGVARLAG